MFILLFAPMLNFAIQGEHFAEMSRSYAIVVISEVDEGMVRWGPLDLDMSILDAGGLRFVDNRDTHTSNGLIVARLSDFCVFECSHRVLMFGTATGA